ncbi:MAG: hypothetical protein CMO01_18700 [Thalassobius sp.]|nr:hypothetical protein [Thalassovita sp.]
MNFLFLLAACSQEQTQISDNKKQKDLPDSIAIDMSDIAIIPLDSSNNWAVKNEQPAVLSTQELAEIDSLLSACLSKYNIEQEKKLEQLKAKHPTHNFKTEDYVINLPNYKRQYIATLNNKGEKEVWVNCFCSTPRNDWNKEIIMVKDGGNCYFNLTINLSTNQCLNFMVNGEA